MKYWLFDAPDLDEDGFRPLGRKWGVRLFGPGGGGKGGGNPAPPPAPTPPPPPPTVEDASVKAADNEKELRQRRGYASTILTGSQGDTSNVAVATKQLLGS